MENMKRLIRPYLRDGVPQNRLFAEMLDVSPRSLQRKLQQAGTSFSDLIETTRFEMAAEMSGGFRCSVDRRGDDSWL